MQEAFLGELDFPDLFSSSGFHNYGEDHQFIEMLIVCYSASQAAMHVITVQIPIMETLVAIVPAFKKLLLDSFRAAFQIVRKRVEIRISH